MIRRETIIALRARHTAFRIAMGVLYPPHPRPAPQVDLAPTDETPADAVPAIDVLDQFAMWSAHQERERRAQRRKVVQLLLVASLWAVVILVNVWNWTHDAATPSTPPQGRPIVAR
jgi:hypothetical protein